MDRKRIAVIGANSFQDPLIRKAKEMGFETHVFAWKEGAVGAETADFFYPVSITEKEEILTVCRDIHPDAVATIASDLAAITVQYVAQRLGLPCNSAVCVARSTNKFAMRKAFLEAGIPTPGFLSLRAGETFDPGRLSFPVIVKPTDRSGSRGITKLDSPKGIGAALAAAWANSFEKRAIVEEFIDGEEFSCECISQNGTHTFLALTKKFTTGAPHFIETGHVQPAGLSPALLEAVVSTVFSALDALHITCGASHSELKVTKDGQVRLIEIGARMGGDCIGSQLVPLSTGYDFIRMVIEAAAGMPVTFAKGPHYEAAAIRFVFGREDLDRLHFIRKEAPELVRFVSEIEPFTRQVVDSSTRYGYYIVAGNDRETLRRVSAL